MNRNLLVFTIIAGIAGPLSAASLKVDIGADAGRRDTTATGFTEWAFNPSNPTAGFGDVKVALRPTKGSGDKLTTFFLKGGIDSGAVLACDGVSSGQIELIISGLAPGTHTIATYHNSPTGKFVSPLNLYVNGSLVISNLQPSVQLTNDYDVASAFLEVRAEAGKDVVVKFTPAGSETNGKVVLNGFEIDNSNPAAKAAKPSPANNDEHVDADGGLLTLGWSAPAGASHNVYFGTNFEAVVGASRKSKLFKGNVKAADFMLTTAEKLNPALTYFWRVDEVDAAGKVSRGEVWRFRTRQLAFPTAEGYGRFARGGRGGRVIEVTNLEDYDSGRGEAVIPGSFRAAVESEGPRTIVFRISGLIRLKRPCAVSKPYCTIAGQTAPGDGICFANFGGGAYGSHDVIIRFLRYRIGDAAKKGLDGAGLGSCDHAIMDHCSISWSSDEGTSSRSAKNVTFQRNIVAEALQHSYHYRANDRTKFETHAFAGSISGNVGSYHHNLLAHCTDRNWSLAGGLNQAGKYAGYLDIRNNVVYNWTARTTDGGVARLNYVNNYYKPNTNNPFVKWLLKLDKLNPAWGEEKYFMTGNVLEGCVDETNNWSAFENSWAKARDHVDEAEVRMNAELFPSFVKTHTAREAFTNVLADVGATFPKQDVIDGRLIEEARDGTTHYTGTKGSTYGDRPSPNFAGIIDEPTDNKSAEGSPNFPWPEYRSTPAPVDSDHDGMPDEWEIAHGLNPNDPSDGNKDLNGDGYTNLEKYLNSLVGEYSLTVKN